LSAGCDTCGAPLDEGRLVCTYRGTRGGRWSRPRSSARASSSSEGQAQERRHDLALALWVAGSSRLWSREACGW
jgi:hypothetical protein